MSSDALESFMTVMQSLKSIAETTIEKDELSFSISEGSALCAVEAPKKYMNSIYSEMDLAIQGKSDDKELTKHLRIIQNHIKNENFAYQFNYKEQSKVTNLHTILRNSSKISARRKQRDPYTFKLKVKSGYLNQIGGQNPNYHFDFGLKNSLTIDCSMEEAKDIKSYLYQDVESLLLCKEWNKADKKNEYFHKIILDKNLAPIFKSFIKSYYEKDNLVDKLTVIHDFVDESFENSRNGHTILKYLLIAFNDKNFHLSELKTLLIISKPFKEHRDLKDLRKELLETYQNKKD